MPGQVHELLPPAWTLRYEMAFYLMFGLCLLPYIGKPILAAWIIATFWHWWPAGELTLLHLPQQPAALFRFGIGNGTNFVSFMEFFFFAGLGAGWIFMAAKPGKHLSLAITLAGIALIILLRHVMSFGGPHPFIPTILLVAVALAVAMLGCAGLEHHGILRLPRAARWAGTVSYPLYILHGSLLNLLHTALMLLLHPATPVFQLGGTGILGPLLRPAHRHFRHRHPGRLRARPAFATPAAAREQSPLAPGRRRGNGRARQSFRPARLTECRPWQSWHDKIRLVP